MLCLAMELETPEEETEYKPIVQDDGTIKFKKKVNIKRGSASKSSGNAFELRVRKDLEEKGWIVDKWSNNLDVESNSIHPSKRIFKRFGPSHGVMTIGTGFPDLLCFKKNGEQYDVVGVEVKSTGSLTQIEKGMCIWYLEKKIFPRIIIARKRKEGRKIVAEYSDFREKYMNKQNKKKK